MWVAQLQFRLLLGRLKFAPNNLRFEQITLLEEFYFF